MEDKIVLKRWRLCLESRIEVHDNIMVAADFRSKPIEVGFSEIIGGLGYNDDCNKKLTEEEFDGIVAKLKNHYFGTAGSDDVEYRW